MIRFVHESSQPFSVNIIWASNSQNNLWSGSYIQL